MLPTPTTRWPAALYFCAAAATACGGASARVATGRGSARAAPVVPAPIPLVDVLDLTPGDPLAPEYATLFAAAARTARHTAAPPGAAALTPDERTLLVVDEDNAALVGLDTATRAVRFSHALGGRPVAVGAASNELVYVLDRDAGLLRAFALRAGGRRLAPLGTARVAPDAVAFALSPDGRRVYVASGAAGALTVLDAATLHVTRTIAVTREPRGLAVAPDGRTVYVGHLVAGVISAVDPDAGTAHTLALPRAPERGTIDRLRLGDAANVQTVRARLARGRSAAALARSLVVDPAGAHLYVAHVAESTGTELPDGDATSHGGYGGLDEAVFDAIKPVGTVSVLDLRTGRWVPPDPNARPAPAPAPQRAGADAGASADDDDADPAPPPALPAWSDPVGLALRPRDGALLLLARGTRSLGVLEPRGSDPAVHGRAVALGECDGAAGVASTRDGTTFVLCQFDHSVAVLDRDGQRVAARVPIGRETLSADAALGRRLFHRADLDEISRVGFSCATCHPDGGDDGNVWSSGVGERQTLALAGRLAGTAPYGWDAHGYTLDLHLQQTIIRLNGTGLDDAPRRAVAAYLLTGMRAAPRVPAVRRDDPLAVRGAAVFAQAGCNGCHDPGRHFADGHAHDVGSANPRDGRARFDTPSLEGLGRSAPFFHDGRYATLEAMLEDNHDRMGHTSSLRADDSRALLAYLRTL